MAALLIVIQIITGIMLRFYYEPFPHKAYESILILQNSVLFGQLIRNIHHWCGVFAVIITFLHLLRVFFTGGFRASRKLNWLIGLALFILIIFSNFTGYLLPWDQLAYWAVTIGTSLLNYIPFIGTGLRKIITGGEEVNVNTLIIFFNFHTAVLPVILVILSVYHFWRVRKAGGITLPESNEPRTNVPSYPDLVYREFIAALALVAVISVFSVLLNAPLLGKADPEYSLNPTKAPWYFAGIQELLMHFHPFVAAFLIPLAIIIMLVWLPYLKLKEEPSGIWFHSDNGKRSAKFSAAVSVFLTGLFVIVNEFIPKFETLIPWMYSFISNGLIPLLIMLLIIWIFYKYTVKKFTLNFTETIQALFVFITTAFIILTLTGIFFRGADMALTFPWNL
jgi:quinol-cytochrome oxidoreductase complex cytochrome b subunit